MIDLQFQWKENTIIYFNVKNPLSTNMIKSLVTGHPQSNHCKSVYTEAAAKAVYFVFYGPPCIIK